MFIKLTAFSDETPIFIKKEYITSIYVDDETNETSVDTIDGGSFVCKESAKEVLDLIKEPIINKQ